MSFLPTEDQATPYPGSPRFFKRRWNTLNTPEVQEPLDGRERRVGVIITPQMDIMIYGYSCRSEYPEDAEVEDRAWVRTRSFPSVCFSEVEPEGEYGFTPLASVEEISKDEFEQARDRGWQ